MVGEVRRSAGVATRLVAVVDAVVVLLILLVGWWLVGFGIVCGVWMSIVREARRSAGIATRLVAAVVDAVVVLAILLSGYGLVAAVSFLVDPLRFSFPRLSGVLNLTAALVLAVLYLAAGWSAGRTRGMAVMGVRIVGAADRRLRPGRAVVRALACVVFPLGLLWSAVDARHRSVQDLLLRTEVIYDWRS